LHLTWGFWAVPIVEHDQHITAVTGPDAEVYVCTTEPMGLSNSPTAFQRLIEHVFQGIFGETVYVDDIMAFSKTWQEDLSILRQVFERLKDSGPKVKFSKCVWAAAQFRVFCEDAPAWASEKAESFFTEVTPKQVRRRFRNKGKVVRLHPKLVGWYLVRTHLRTGDQVWRCLQ
jgi:hypothetical protein